MDDIDVGVGEEEEEEEETRVCRVCCGDTDIRFQRVSFLFLLHRIDCVKSSNYCTSRSATRFEIE